MSQAETRSGIDSLHARAEASYRSGDFEDARAAWTEILSRDPADERAREGLKLLSLVDPKWAVFEEAEREAGGEPAAEIREIRALVRAGQLTEARQRLDHLAARFAGDEAVAGLARELAAAESVRSTVDTQLEAARRALAAGDPAAAIETCRQVLANAPGDRDAERLLEEAEAALAPDPAEDPLPDLPLDLELDLDAIPAVGGGASRPAGTPGPAGEDPARDGGGPGPEPLDELPAIPLAAPPPGPAAPVSSPAPNPEAPDGDPPDLDDLFEAARELEREVPVEELQAPGTALPPEPSPAGEGEAALLVARAREELERGRTTEATQLAARALAVDPNHAEAEEILEEARRRDEERARQAEDLVAQAVQALEGGQPHLAIPLLRQVLELIPDHGEARDLLARAEAAEAVLPEIPTGAEVADAPAVPLAEPAPPPETHDLQPVREPVPPPAAPEPPPAGAAAPRQQEPPPRSPGRAGRRRPAFRRPGKGALAVAAVLVLAAGGGVAWRLGLLPHVGAAPAAGEVPAPAPRPAGKRRRADRRPHAPAAPGPAAAAAAPAEGTGAAAGKEPPPAEPRVTKEDVPRLVRRAERALRAGDEARAVELLELARRADPLDFDLVEKLETARTRLRERRKAEAQLAEAKREFRQGNWPEALRILYRIPGPYRPPGIDGWIADGWYNLGVQSLQAGDVVEARRYFSDCLELAPDDEAARRHREVALRYRGEPLDDAYWMYVRALKVRPLRD